MSDTLLQIMTNHEERSFLREPFNAKIDYVKEAYQQHSEISHLLTFICVMLKEVKANEQRRKETRNRKAKGKTYRAGSSSTRKTKTQER